jgi:predicted enzyme related to lactoylglutathione lyase
MKMTNPINWFEIPVKYFDRAKAFYTIILDGEIRSTYGGRYKIWCLAT